MLAMHPALSSLAASFPVFIDNQGAPPPGISPFDADTFAAWALRVGPGLGGPGRAGEGPLTAAVERFFLAGFVLSFVPPAERSDLVLAVAWHDPMDPAMLARVSLVCSEQSRQQIAAALVPMWHATSLEAAERLARSVSPLNVALRIGARIHVRENPEHVRISCPRCGQSASLARSAAGIAGLTCERCGFSEDALALSARALGRPSADRSAAVRGLF